MKKETRYTVRGRTVAAIAEQLGQVAADAGPDSKIRSLEPLWALEVVTGLTVAVEGEVES